MRRPLTGIALLFGAGTWLGLRLAGAIPTPYLLVAAACILLLCVLGMLAHWDAMETGGVLALVLALGVVSAAVPRGGTTISDVYDAEPGERVVAELQGLIATEPAMDTNGNLNFTLQVDQLVLDQAVHRLQYDLPVRIYGHFRQPPQYGEIWRFAGKLRRLPNEYRRHWWFAGGVSGATRQAPAATTLAVWAQQLRRSAAATLQAGVDTHTNITDVVQALLLGYRARLPSSVQTAFRRTGTMHVFAISGLHVGILCAVLVFGTNLLRMPRTCRVLLLGPVILSYAFVTGARASAIRAGLMAVAYLGAPLVGRRGDTWSAVAFAALIILLWQPQQLEDPGFVFSFTAVAGILAFIPLAERLLRRHIPQDPFALRGEGPRWRETLLLWAGRLTAVSVAAWFSTAPLSMYYFGRFAPVALLANLIVLPLAFLIVVTGILSLAGGALAGGMLASIFNHANLVYVHVLVGGMQVLAAVPGGHFENIHLPLPYLWLWYAVLFGLAGYLHQRITPPPQEPVGAALDGED